MPAPCRTARGVGAQGPGYPAGWWRRQQSPWGGVQRGEWEGGEAEISSPLLLFMLPTDLAVLSRLNSSKLNFRWCIRVIFTRSESLPPRSPKNFSSFLVRA